MKEPKIVREETVYYSLYFWHFDGKKLADTLSVVYKTPRGAERKAREVLSSGKYKSATIRKEEVWYRDENNEFSSSGIFKEIYA